MARGLYRMAPMDWVMWLLTAVVLAVPVVLVATEDRRAVLAAAGMLALCGAVWLYGRPRWFEVSPSALSIVWPVRRRKLARANIARATVMTRHDFRQRFGRSVRIGVGGLFGQFGFSLTDEGRVLTYVSTLGPWVLVELHEGRPVLISPEHPEELVRELEVELEG